jgi:hypothetical protein
MLIAAHGRCPSHSRSSPIRVRCRCTDLRALRCGACSRRSGLPGALKQPPTCSVLPCSQWIGFCARWCGRGGYSAARFRCRRTGQHHGQPATSVTFGLSSDARTLAIWPHKFELSYTITLTHTVCRSPPPGGRTPPTLACRGFHGRPAFADGGIRARGDQHRRSSFRLLGASQRRTWCGFRLSRAGRRAQGCLHTYFRFDDSSTVEVHGLQGTCSPRRAAF